MADESSMFEWVSGGLAAAVAALWARLWKQESRHDQEKETLIQKVDEARHGQMDAEARASAQKQELYERLLSGLQDEPDDGAEDERPADGDP